MEGVLDVAGHGVDPMEHQMGGTGRAAAGDQRHVRAESAADDAGEAVEAVGDDGGARCEVALGPTGARAVLQKPGSTSMRRAKGKPSGVICMAGRHERGLAGAGFDLERRNAFACLLPSMAAQAF